MAPVYKALRAEGHMPVAVSEATQDLRQSVRFLASYVDVGFAAVSSRA